MRSSPSGADPLLAGTAGFAHRGLHGPNVPENSLASVRQAIAIDAGIECDLQLSLDGFAMVFHDNDLRRLCGLDVTVDSLNAASLMRLRLAGSAEHIPWLGALLDLVDGRVPILLELKYARGRMDQFCQAVASTVRRYEGPLGVMSFEASAGQWFAANAPHLRRGLVLTGRDLPWERALKIKRSRCDFVAVKVSAVSGRWLAELRRGGMSVLCWTVRTPQERAQAAVHADALIWEGDGRPRN